MADFTRERIYNCSVRELIALLGGQFDKFLTVGVHNSGLLSKEFRDGDIESNFIRECLNVDPEGLFVAEYNVQIVPSNNGVIYSANGVLLSKKNWSREEYNEKSEMARWHDKRERA